MYKNYLSKNLFIFVLITAISIGGLIVYAMNNMDDSNNNNNSSTLGNKTSASQKTNQADDQTIQNFDINKTQSENTNEPTTQPQDNSGDTPVTNQPTQSQPQPQPQTVQNVTELTIEDVVVGSGAQVKNGDSVEVNYLGTFLNGQKFDSSYDRNQTFEFSVGAGQVIRGWDQGLVGMKVGGKRILLIPSDLAYGAAGAPGAIPPNTPLKFEIELVSIK